MSGVTAVLGAVIIWSIYTGGQARGMDHVLAYGVEIDVAPMSVALSDSVYGVNGGYVGLTSVYHALIIGLSAGTNTAAAIEQNIGNREVINAAIRAAMTLTPQQAAYGNISDSRVMTLVYSDLGSVDYIKLAFRLFGTRVEALYQTFFVILAVSALLFVATFPNSLAAQLTLLGTLFAFLMELQTPIWSQGMPTFVGVRHSSTLCLIPAWYFALLFLQRRRFSWLMILLTAGQLAVLILAIAIRSTAIWTVVFLSGLALVCGTYRYVRAPKMERTPALWRRSVVAWPVVVLIAAVLIQGQYTKSKLHPIYFTDDVLPYHPVWHAAYVGLQYSPELYGMPMSREMAGADDWAFEGALKYLQSTHFIGNEGNLSTRQALEAGGYYSKWNGGGPKWGLHDRIMRTVVLQIVKQHPWKVMYMLAFKKPYAIWQNMSDLVKRADPAWNRLTLTGGFIGGVLLIVFGRRHELVELVRVVPVGIGAIVASVLACIWAYPNSWSVVDGLLLSFGMMVVVIGMTVAGAYHLVVLVATRVRGQRVFP